jgi:hypothetical protein
MVKWLSLFDALRASAVAILLLIAQGVYAADTYERPFGPRAPWNIPVARLARHPNPQLYVPKLWRDAPSERPGNFNLSFDEYTYPVYSARHATETAVIRFADEDNPVPRLEVPWNPAWKPAAGKDAQMIILDPDKGIEWDLWQVRTQGRNVVATRGSRVEGDYRTKEDGHRPSRGVGLPYLAMLVRPQEIAQGAIRHALSLTIRDTDGAIAVPPATKLEFPDRQYNGIPLGMRFALDVTDEDVARWLETIPKQYRRAGAIIARALRDYGAFVTDTAGGAHFQFESRLTGDEGWRDAGLSETTADDKVYPRDLLDGLITPARLYAVVPSDQYPHDLLARPTPSDSAGSSQ